MTDVAYVGGFGRSGSTLLEQILASFPGVCALGEVVNMWERGLRENESCGCGERFADCPFWRAVGDRAFGGWQHVDADAVLALADEVDRIRHIPADLFAQTTKRPASRARRLAEYAAYYERVYAAAAEVSGATVVLDSSKDASTAFALRSARNVRLTVVHLVRDSRGVAYSWTKTVRRPEARLGGDHETMHRYAPWRAAVLWDGHNAAFGLLARTGVPVRRVLYEQLLDDPVGTVRRIAAGLGLDASGADAVITPTHATLRPSHQVAGNPMRFQHGQLALRSDEAWHEQFPAGSRRLVTALTAPLMAHYGYFGAGLQGTR